VEIKAVIFDLDGVIVSTDEFHYQAWQSLADGEGIYFDRKINDNLRGISRMESLEIILRKATKKYSDSQKAEMAARKNNYYCKLLEKLSPADLLPSVTNILNDLRTRGIKMAVGSSSKNSPVILNRIGLGTYFDATADGNDIKKSKPDPEVFLLAAERLKIASRHCLVIEDATAGVEAAINAKMYVLAIGQAKSDMRAHLRANDLASADFVEIFKNHGEYQCQNQD